MTSFLSPRQDASQRQVRGQTKGSRSHEGTEDLRSLLKPGAPYSHHKKVTENEKQQGAFRGFGPGLLGLGREVSGTTDRGGGDHRAE